MSQRELIRRKILKYVMKKAWHIYKQALNISFNIALKVAWKLIRGYSHFSYSKTRGVALKERQSLLRRLSQYSNNRISLSLVREATNTYDKNAIKIIAAVTGRGSALIGYVPQELALRVAPALDTGHQVIILFESVTGLEYKNKTLGLNFSYLIV